MPEYWSDSAVSLYLGDCVEVMREMPANSVDSICTDPPYGLEFMDREWDGPAGFQRSLNVAAAGRGSASKTAEYRTSGAGQRGKPGIGGQTDWVSNQGWNGFRCRNCGHLSHGGSPCQCEHPDFARSDDRWLLYQAWCEAWASECLRLLKPGGHLVAFGGTRTWHRLACAIEDAGFEIRDSIHWIYAAGFPKSLNVSKAIDKAAGAEREALGTQPDRWTGKGGVLNFATDRPQSDVTVAGGPATEDAVRWDGFGTALKPAHEPIVLARKPLAGTVAQNVLEHGTGALNIDACRVATVSGGADTGRWPPNVVFSHAPGCRPIGTTRVRGSRIEKPSAPLPGNRSTYSSGLDGARPARGIGDADGMETVEVWDCAPGCAVADLDRQSGVRTSGANPTRRSSDKFRDIYGDFAGHSECVVLRGDDTGGASRFFPAFRYEAKAGQHERPRLADGTSHPTVKPVELIRWLVKLVTPPRVSVLVCSECGEELPGTDRSFGTCPSCGGALVPSERPGLVLDPFAGSGTTGEACVVDAYRCVLIERDSRYAELIKARLRRPIALDLFGGGA